MAYSILSYPILYDTILHYTILILYYTNTILYYTILILYYTILYYTILYYTILYYTILYYTNLRIPYVHHVLTVVRLYYRLAYKRLQNSVFLCVVAFGFVSLQSRFFIVYRGPPRWMSMLIVIRPTKL